MWARRRSARSPERPLPALAFLLLALFLGARLARARRRGSFGCGDHWGERRDDDGFGARCDCRSLDEVNGPGRGGHVQVPDLELRFREVMHDSADAHVLGARCEVAERVEANDGIRVVLLGGSCRRHAERLLAVVELEGLPAGGDARLWPNLVR